VTGREEVMVMVLSNAFQYVPVPVLCSVLFELPTVVRALFVDGR